MISDVLQQVANRSVVVFNKSATIGRLIAHWSPTNLALSWYLVAVRDWLAIEIMQSSMTINDHRLLLSSEDYCQLLKPLVWQSPIHRRVIKDNLRPLPTSLVSRRYLVLPLKPAAD